jgi:hypothetical protein
MYIMIVMLILFAILVFASEKAAFMIDIWRNLDPSSFPGSCK